MQMPSRLGPLCALLLALPGVGFAAPPTAGSGALARTAEDVLARNAVARGGLEAWRKIDRVVWLGHIEPAVQEEGVPNPKFVAHLERPNHTRFEVKSRQSNFARIFDGEHGWRTRPAKDGRPSVTPFPKSEVDFAKSEFVVDGPLLDAAAKGVKVSLDGLDTLEGERTYRLSLRLPNGGERKVWIDTKTNLEVRIDRPAGTGVDPNRPVSTYYRDWSDEDGLMLPHAIETASMQADNGVELPRRDRVVIEGVLVNPKFEALTFAMPAVPMRRNSKTEVHIDSGDPSVTKLSR
jgi:hypothetical protein